MSERLPSTRALYLMSSQDQFWILQRITDETREDRQHILSGCYYPGPGHTRHGILDANRRKLARVYAHADVLGLDVGQPGRPVSPAPRPAA